MEIPTIITQKKTNQYQETITHLNSRENKITSSLMTGIKLKSQMNADFSNRNWKTS